MRILGYIDHPYLKITVFKMDTRLSVKLEDAFFEQTYKFRQEDRLSRFEDVKRLIDKPFIEGVLDHFKQMHALRDAALNRNLPAGENEFEEII